MRFTSICYYEPHHHNGKRDEIKIICITVMYNHNNLILTDKLEWPLIQCYQLHFQ